MKQIIIHGYKIVFQGSIAEAQSMISKPNHTWLVKMIKHMQGEGYLLSHREKNTGAIVFKKKI
jgi:hypothetical protein